MIIQKTFYYLDIQNCPQEIKEAAFDLGAEWGWNNDSHYILEIMDPEVCREVYNEPYARLCTYFAECQIDKDQQVLVHFWW